MLQGSSEGLLLKGGRQGLRTLISSALRLSLRVVPNVLPQLQVSECAAGPPAGKAAGREASVKFKLRYSRAYIPHYAEAEGVKIFNFLFNQGSIHW